MAKSGNLITASEQHSVKEAVISFSICPKITDLSLIENLIGEGKPLHNLYQQFEPVNIHEIKVEPKLNKTEISDIIARGFKMISFEAGKVADIVQGIPQNQSTLLTFNTINYRGWSEFLGKSLNTATLITDVLPNFYLEAIGVMFVDEFYFADEMSYDPNDIFNIQSRIIPQNILESDLTDFSLSNHKNVDGIDYMENVSIQVFTDIDSKNKVIRVTGNIMSFINRIKASEILRTGDVTRYLDFGHDQNKLMLKNILSEQALNLIGLC